MAKKILVIDDEEILIKTFSHLLEKQGYEVLFALRGPDAMALAEAEDFDLVLSDIRLPGQNGVEIVRNIYELLKKEKRNCPAVIFITGYADQDLERQAKELNPIAFLSKPFDTLKLLKLIKEKIGK